MFVPSVTKMLVSIIFHFRSILILSKQASLLGYSLAISRTSREVSGGLVQF